VQGAGALGAVAINARCFVYPTGVQATGQVGTVTVITKANVSVTGVSATGRVSRPLVWGLIDTAQTPSWVPIAA